MAEQKAKKTATQQTNKLFELNSKVALLKQAIDLLKRYLEVVNQRYELNNQYVKAVIQWNDALYVIHQSYLLRAKEDIINESRATLKRNQDALRILSMNRVRLSNVIRTRCDLIKKIYPIK